jgi:hypothetical protein
MSKFISPYAAEKIIKLLNLSDKFDDESAEVSITPDRTHMVVRVPSRFVNRLDKITEKNVFEFHLVTDKNTGKRYLYGVLLEESRAPAKKDKKSKRVTDEADKK